MKLIDRVRNIWRLSQYEPGVPQDEYKIPGTKIITLVHKPEVSQPAVFIPRTPVKPIDRIKSLDDAT